MRVFGYNHGKIIEHTIENVGNFYISRLRYLLLNDVWFPYKDEIDQINILQIDSNCKDITIYFVIEKKNK